MRLASTTGFLHSLQREQGAVKAFLDGWKVFGKQTVLIGNQEFVFQSISNALLTLNMRFSSVSPLPHDINVLIGPNGVGKSQLLMQIVTNLLELDPDKKLILDLLENLTSVKLLWFPIVPLSYLELIPLKTLKGGITTFTNTLECVAVSPPNLSKGKFLEK